MSHKSTVKMSYLANIILPPEEMDRLVKTLDMFTVICDNFYSHTKDKEWQDRSSVLHETRCQITSQVDL